MPVFNKRGARAKAQYEGHDTRSSAEAARSAPHLDQSQNKVEQERSVMAAMDVPPARFHRYRVTKPTE